MTDAGAVVDWGFGERGLAKVWAREDSRNAGSTRAMEKLGMSREGVHRSQQEEGRPKRRRLDEAHCGLLREEWNIE